MIPLSELQAEFGTVQIMEGTELVAYRCLWFELGGQFHMMPFGPVSKKDRVWLHAGGDTIDDLTLIPSYVSDGVHGFIRNGHWLPC